MKLGVDYLNRAIPAGRVNFPLSLAPMVGLTHVAARAMVRRYLPEGAITFWPTEMLSSWRLPREEMGATAETLKNSDESDLVPQILGNEEEPIRLSVAKLAEWGAIGVDINMGCPVAKALKHNYGVALMGDPDYAAKVVRMTVRHSSVPVSVKLRAGLQSDPEFLLRFVRGLENAGAAWITLHPRVGHMKRRGAADWTQIQLVRNSLSIPVIGNGDVQNTEDVWAMLEQTGCDGVMVGRALLARPWLLWQVGEKLGFSNPQGFNGSPPRTPEEEGREYGRAALFMLGELERHFTWEDGAKRFRFYIRMTMGWLEFGQHLFSLVTRAKSYEELRQALFRFFESEQRMSSRTQLRE